MMNDFMETISMLREIVNEIDVSDIPLNYIAGASYKDEHGGDQVVHGPDEIENLLRRLPPYRGIENVNLLLDFRQIAIDVSMETTCLFDNIEKAFLDDINNGSNDEA